MRDEKYKFVINLYHIEILVKYTEEYVEHALFKKSKASSPTTGLYLCKSQLTLKENTL